MLDLQQTMDENHFCHSYQDSRNHFLKVQQELPPLLVQDVQAYPHPLAGPNGEALFCDTLLLGESQDISKLLVLNSATHGVEGFAGSAIQCANLAFLAAQVQQQAGLGVLVIHAFNPWGFAWLRRCDHEGIDLNRNFIDFSVPPPSHPQYHQIHSELFVDDFGDETLVRLFAQYGFEAFVEQLTRGQYTHADGIFYGGNRASWSRGVLEQMLQAPLFQRLDRIAVIDLHTGLGPYGYGEVINDHLLNTTAFDLVNQWYGANAASVELGESVSARKQGLLDYRWHEAIGERGNFVTLEFGTYSVKQLISSLIKEQYYHQALKQLPRDLNHPDVIGLRNFFYPAEKSWQQQVLFRGHQLINLAIEGMGL